MTPIFTPRKETDIQREIMLYLKARRRFFWRVNTTGTFDPGKKIFLKPHNLTKGTADIFVLKQSVLYAIEVKSEKGKQSPDQILFQQDIEKNGGVYLLARCVDEIIKAGL